MRNLKMSYYNIYYYCNIADNLLSYFNGYIDWAPTGAQFTEPFFSEKPTNFPKYSALHTFCEFVIRRIIHEDTHKELEEIQTEYDNLESISDKRGRLIQAFNYDIRFHNNTKLEIDRLLIISKSSINIFLIIYWPMISVILKMHTITLSNLIQILMK